MSRLRDLDDRVVPYAAERLRGVVSAGRVATGGDQPARRRGPLQRLDDRYARGPVPRLAALALAAVLLGGGGVLLSGAGLDGPDDVSVEQAQEDLVLGPEPGTTVTDYLAASRSRAADLSRERPDAEHLALVSFEAYARPEQAKAALGDLEVVRAYLRVPGEQPSEVLEVNVDDFVGDLQALYPLTAQRKAEDAEELRRLAEGMPEGSEARRAHQAAAEQAAREARAYATGCGCIFAVVARAPAATLAPLPAMEGFRAAELAPRGAELDELEFRMLLPEQTLVVSPPPEAPSPAGG